MKAFKNILVFSLFGCKGLSTITPPIDDNTTMKDHVGITTPFSVDIWFHNDKLMKNFTEYSDDELIEIYQKKDIRIHWDINKQAKSQSSI